MHLPPLQGAGYALWDILSSSVRKNKKTNKQVPTDQRTPTPRTGAPRGWRAGRGGEGRGGAGVGGAANHADRQGAAHPTRCAPPPQSSLDSDIRAATTADIEGLVRRHPSIRRIVFVTGKGSADTFRKHFGEW